MVSSMTTVADLNRQMCALKSKSNNLSSSLTKKTAQLSSIEKAIGQIDIAEKKQYAIIDQLNGMQISGRWKGKRASDFRQSVKGKGAVWSDAVAVYEAIVERKKILKAHKENLESQIGNINSSINKNAAEIESIKKQQLLLNSAK